MNFVHNSPIKCCVTSIMPLSTSKQFKEDIYFLVNCTKDEYNCNNSPTKSNL